MLGYKEWKSWNEEEGLSRASIWSIARVHAVPLGGTQFGLNRSIQEKGRIRFQRSRLEVDMIRTLLATPDGGLWIGGDPGALANGYATGHMNHGRSGCLSKDPYKTGLWITRTYLGVHSYRAVSDRLTAGKAGNVGLRVVMRNMHSLERTLPAFPAVNDRNSPVRWTPMVLVIHSQVLYGSLERPSVAHGFYVPVAVSIRQSPPDPLRSRDRHPELPESVRIISTSRSVPLKANPPFLLNASIQPELSSHPNGTACIARMTRWRRGSDLLPHSNSSIPCNPAIRATPEPRVPIQIDPSRS